MSKVNLKNPIKFLVNQGTEGISDEETISRITVVNILSIAVSASLLVIAPIICYYFNWRLPVVIAFTTEFIINWSVIILNYHKKHLTASIVVYYLQCIVVIYYGFLLGWLLQLDLVIVLMIFVTFLIFKNRNQRIIAVAAALFDLVILECIYFKNPSLSTIPISFNVAFLIHGLVMIAIITIVLLVSRPYVESNDLRYELKRANSFIKIFVAQTTHELRTPLNAIHQIGQLLKKTIQKDDNLKSIESLVNISLVASTNARSTINNVLDMAEIESGRIERVVRESFFVQSFFSKMIEWNKVVAQIENMKLKLSIVDMPPIIISDPLNLGQITTNLVANAIKYGVKGETIHVNIAGQDNKWTLQVINQGPGISREKIESIFDPFVTGKTSYIEGTGLGLYIVKNKVAAMNGTIQVESIPYRHTIFTVTLPLTAGKLKDVPEEREETEEVLMDLRNTQILIAEDHRLSALMLFTNLHELGCNVISVENGWELLQSAARNHPDVIILDYHMPIMDGEQTVLELKKNPSLRHIPIVVSTGDIFSESLDKILTAGADAYIEKPIDIHSLQKIISRLLAKHND
jgi:signal transduction histidine kinase/CheY-like chemotaxis protein